VKAVRIPQSVQLERRTASRAAVMVDGFPELGVTNKMKVDMLLMKELGVF
jgi:hypothetical protein